jgi:hypothetical protein
LRKGTAEDKEVRDFYGEEPDDAVANDQLDEKVVRRAAAEVCVSSSLPVERQEVWLNISSNE